MWFIIFLENTCNWWLFESTMWHMSTFQTPHVHFKHDHVMHQNFKEVSSFCKQRQSWVKETGFNKLLQRIMSSFTSLPSLLCLEHTFGYQRKKILTWTFTNLENDLPLAFSLRNHIEFQLCQTIIKHQD